MKAMVGARAPLPARAIATGAMRTIVRLSAAYATTCQVTCGSSLPSASAPKPIQTTAASNPPTSSLSLVTRSPCRRESRPNAIPPTKAAMKPLPPNCKATA